jgi:hypothetical protein
MLHRNPTRRTGLSNPAIILIVVGVGLFLFLIAGCCLGVIFLQGFREGAKRVECSNNLRIIHTAMNSYEVKAGVLPTERPNPAGPMVSFYTLFLSELEQGEAAAAIARGQQPTQSIRQFLCPSRRTPQTAPGKRDYGYVTFGNSTPGRQAVLDSPGGAALPTITNMNGTTNTALLSHVWMSPQTYSGGDPTDVGWSANPPQNARTQAQPFEDSNAGGNTSSMGSPHSSTMPVIFVDGHIGYLSYMGFGTQNWTAIWNLQNTTPIAFPRD